MWRLVRLRFSGTSKPVVVHLLQELASDRKPRCGSDHGIYTALGTQRSAVSFLKPLFDLRRRKHTQAKEAPAHLASLDLLPVASRVLMGAIVVAAFVIVDEWLTHFAERYRSAATVSGATRAHARGVTDMGVGSSGWFGLVFILIDLIPVKANKPSVFAVKQV